MTVLPKKKVLDDGRCGKHQTHNHQNHHNHKTHKLVFEVQISSATAAWSGDWE